MKGGRIAAFLDRDGTVNEEVEWLCLPEQLRLIPGAGAAIRSLNDHGILTCIISNQAAIARGFLREEDLPSIHTKLHQELLSAGAKIDRIYYCPHHPTEGKPPYDIVCECRKPATGMLRAAEVELGIDLERSFVVGDRIVDIQAGKAVGATTVLVLTGYGSTSLARCVAADVQPDFTAPSIVEAVEFILQRIHGAHDSQT